MTFCPADRTHITLSVWDVEGGELLSGPREMAGLSLLEQVALVDERLDTLNKSIRVATGSGFAQNYVRQLPPGAVREAVLNGVVHRDWMQPDPVAVVWIEEDSAIEVVSPGGFAGGITSDTALTQRYARYPALADLFRALRLVEKQGLGVDRMYRDMVVLGHRPPVLREEAGPRVRVRLVGGHPVVPVMNLMASIRPEVRQRDVRVALIVHTLLHEPFTTAADRRRAVLPYLRPDLAGAESVARRWLSGHDRYSSGDHSALTGLTYAGARGQLERLERAGVLIRGEGSGRSAHFVAGPALYRANRSQSNVPDQAGTATGSEAGQRDE